MKLSAHHAVDTRHRGAVEHVVRLETDLAETGDLVTERKNTRRRERQAAQSRWRIERERHSKEMQEYGKKVATAKQHKEEEQRARVERFRQMRLEQQAMVKARRNAAADEAAARMSAEEEEKLPHPPPRVYEHQHQQRYPQQHQQSHPHQQPVTPVRPKPQRPRLTLPQPQLLELPQPEPEPQTQPTAYEAPVSPDTFAALAAMRDGWGEGWESRADDADSRAVSASSRGLSTSGHRPNGAARGMRR